MENNEPDFTDGVIEKMLLKRCLTDKKYLGIVSNLYDKRWIDNDNVRILLGVVITYFKKYGDVPNNTVIQALVGKYSEKHPEVEVARMNETLCEVCNMNLRLSEEVVKHNLQMFIESKAMFWSISDNLKQIEQDRNVDKCLDRFNSIRKMSLEDNNLGMNYFSAEGQADHWKYITNPEAKMRSGWSGVDSETHGGFLKDGRMLALFCGQAGLGKSLFLSNLAYNLLKQDYKVVVISLEMSENVYGLRFSAHISGDNINQLKNTAITSREKIAKFYQDHPNANLYIKEYPPRSIRVLDVENYLDLLKENGMDFDAVVIDYLNLLLPNSKFDNTYQSMMAVAEQLRALSYKFNVPVFSASQFNRQGMNNTNVGIENISDSSGLSFTADFIGLLYRADGDLERGIINMRLGKNRFGSPGKVIPFILDSDSLVLHDQTFVEHPEDDHTESDNIINNLPGLSGDMETL